MIGILIFGLGFVFMIALVLSLLVNPALASEERSAEDAGSKELGA